jgi:hypothetical protein
VTVTSTVAIIGSHPRTRADFDFSRTDADVWMFNEVRSNPDNHNWAKRADMIWQMHVPAIWRNPTNRNDPKHYEWLKSQTECDVMMQDVYEDVPRSVKYPLSDILAMLHGDPNHFLSSSVPQAIAYAIWTEKYTRIEVYGVAMETQTEYQFQREGVAYWIGFAKGRGIDLFFADPTFIVPLYGYEGKVSVEYDKFDSRIAELQTFVPELTQKFTAARMDAKKALELFVADGSKDNEQTLQVNVGKAVELCAQLGALDGAIQENQRYKGKADAMKAAAGGEFLFSRQEFEAAAKSLSDQAGKERTKYIAHGTEMGILADNIRQAPKGSQKRQKLGEQFQRLLFGNYLQSVNRMNGLQGAANEDMQYMAYLDKYIRAAGGDKSEAVLLESMANVPAL